MHRMHGESNAMARAQRSSSTVSRGSIFASPTSEAAVPMELRKKPSLTSMRAATSLLNESKPVQKKSFVSKLFLRALQASGNSADQLIAHMNMAMSILAVMGIFFWICEFSAIVIATPFHSNVCKELEGLDEIVYIFSDESKFFQACYTSITFLHLCLVFAYYKVLVKTDGQVNNRLTLIENVSIWGSSFRFAFVLEMLTVVVQPIPGVGPNGLPGQSMDSDLVNQQVKIGNFMFMRLYVLCRVARDRSYLYRQRRDIVNATKSSDVKPVRFDWFYTFKALFNKSPGKVTGILLLGSIIACSVMFYVAEWSSVFHVRCDSNNNVTHTFDLSDSIYLTFITMATVGYGDIYPVTNMGRTVAIIAAILGVLLGSLLISAVCQRLALSLHELWCISWAWTKSYEAQEREAAALLIQLWYARYTDCKRHDHQRVTKKRFIPVWMYDLFRLDEMALYHRTLHTLRDTKAKRKRHLADFYACGDQIQHNGVRSRQTVLHRVSAMEPRLTKLEERNAEIMAAVQQLVKISQVACGATNMDDDGYQKHGDCADGWMSSAGNGSSMTHELDYDELDDAKLDPDYEPGYC